MPEQCGYKGVLTLTMGRLFGTEMKTSDDAMQFVRDPENILELQTKVPFGPSVAMPADAYFTGLQSDGIEDLV